MFKKIFLLTSIVATTYGCNGQKQADINFSDAIVSAQALRFEQVENTLGKENVRYCCTYAYLHADEGRRQGFDIKNGYFVNVRLNLDLIAYATFEHSCGTLMHKRKGDLFTYTKKCKI